MYYVQVLTTFYSVHIILIEMLLGIFKMMLLIDNLAILLINCICYLHINSAKKSDKSKKN